jgi:hypothetical protein
MVEVKYYPIKELDIYEAYTMPVKDVVVRRGGTTNVPTSPARPS